MAANVNQYAVKVVQGTIPTSGDPRAPLGPGIYFTSVNVHNPWDFTVEYFTKYAAAGDSGNGGVVGPWNTHQLKLDAVTQYHAADFIADPVPPAFREGYFVIECSYELDIVGVYTGSMLDGRLATMKIERVPARKVPSVR